MADFAELIAAWEADENLEGDLVHVEHSPERAAITAGLDPPLPPLLALRLAERGIERLYRHQVEMIRSIRGDGAR